MQFIYCNTKNQKKKDLCFEANPDIYVYDRVKATFGSRS